MAAIEAAAKMRASSRLSFGNRGLKISRVATVYIFKSFEIFYIFEVFNIFKHSFIFHFLHQRRKVAQRLLQHFH